MLLRTALLSLAALTVCQTAYSQSGFARYPAARVPVRAVRPVSYNDTVAVPGPSVPNAPATMGSPQMDYGAGAVPMEEMPVEAGCDGGGCGPTATNYVPWWHRAFVWSYWKCHGLPSPWNAPGDLTPHFPYTPCGSTYYYFRPYNWFHIPAQQAEAANYDSDPRNPYDNRVVFEGLYDGLAR